MIVPVPDDDPLTQSWLDKALAASPAWPHGPLQCLTATRIGTHHGFSGRCDRLTATTADGARVSVVVKRDHGRAVARELLCRSHVEARAGTSIPACFGGWVDDESGRGVLLLEDIAPAEQGDVLAGCSAGQAAAAMRSLARFHSASWNSDFREAPRWSATPMSALDWATHLARARERFPEAVPDAAAFEDIPERVANAVDRFRDGPAAWLHVDCHLDNVLWRPDGSAVLLDFAGAAVGPPEVDLARLLSEGIEPAWRPALVEAYVDELARQDGEAGGVDTGLLQERFDLALPVLVQAAVTWAAAAKPSVPRAAVVRERWLASVCGLALER